MSLDREVGEHDDACAMGLGGVCDCGAIEYEPTKSLAVQGPAVTQVIATREKDCQDTLEYLEKYSITTDEEHAEACEYLDSLGKVKTELETQSKSFSKAAYDAWQNELKPWRKPKKLIDKGIAILKELIGDYVIAKNHAEQKALAAAAEGEDGEAIEQVATASRSTKGVSTTVSYTFRVTDPKLVPDKYCIKTVNLRQVEIAVEEGVREIPGIEIYPKADVRRVGRRSAKESA